MSINQPTPPDPYATAAAQQQMNTEAATKQQEMNMVNQTTPLGSLQYTQTGTNPDGTPIYSSQTTLSPAEQGLFNSTVGTQQKAADTANQLMTNLGPSLTQAPNLGNEALTQQMMGWQSKYMQPIFNQQSSNLNSQLAAQGLGAGSTAFDNAQNLLARNQGNVMEGALAQFEPLAYNQAVSSYQLPIQTLGTLLSAGSPQSATAQNVQTPTASIQPANYQGLAEQNYAQQNQIYGNTMAGLFGLGGNLAKAAILG